MEKGSLLIVLNTHMPVIHDAQSAVPLEENWLHEAVSECYLPLIHTFKKLFEDGIPFKITLSFTPCLLEMLADPLLQKRYVRYLDDHIRLGEEEIRRLTAQDALRRVAQQCRQHFAWCKEEFLNTWDGNLIRGLQYLHKTGCVEFLASSATHAYSPLWQFFPRTLALQTRIGIRRYRQYFDCSPRGYWLPECAFYPGLDALLAREGIDFTFLDAHGVLNGFPRPLYGVHAPLLTPTGLAVFGRDWASHDLVWLKDKGYPGDPYYLNYDRDIGYDLDAAQRREFLHTEHAQPTGYRYYRLGRQDGSDIYEPDKAFQRCDRHAAHFLGCIQEQAETLNARLGRQSVLVALFDTEHFGHWWHEGPTWLELLIRKMACDQDVVKPVGGSQFIAMNPVLQTGMPSMSSWGYQGYNETWLMGRNHWIYPRMYAAIEALDAFLERTPCPSNEQRQALDQYLREFLLAQSSDWAFILHQQTAQQYAETRLNRHLENMTAIMDQLTGATLDLPWLASLKERYNIFADLDLLDLYKQGE